MITIKKLTSLDIDDANIPNEPFTVWGRMTPIFDGESWSSKLTVFDESYEMCFPDFHYEMTDDSTFFGAYDENKCVGLAVLRDDMFSYLCLDDLKVCREYRKKGIGRMLIDACMSEAESRGKTGVYAIAQDNNLSACLFYQQCGFEIGGFDNRSYRGTNQAEKSNIFFYRDVHSGSKSEDTDLKDIYKALSSEYDLILTTTSSLEDGYTIDVPVIRGKRNDARFDLYKDEELFVFSIEYYDKTGMEKYTHFHPMCIEDAINDVKNFMLEDKK